jgi:hypothetical protein
MGNVSEKYCRENQNTHFMFSNFFRKSHRLWDNSKNVVETKGPHTSQHGAYALHAGLARLHALIRVHTLTQPRTNMHARTHRSISNIYCFSTAIMVSRTPLNVTLHVHCVLLIVKLTLVNALAHSAIFSIQYALKIVDSLSLKAKTTETSLFTYLLHKGCWLIYKCSKLL